MCTRHTVPVLPDAGCAVAPERRQRIRLERGGYCRDHLRALAQRVEVADGEVRIMGSKSGCSRRLWRTAAQMQRPLRD